MITFISGMIVNKDYYSEIPHQHLRDLVGTGLVQLGWFLPVLASSSNNLYVWERLVAGRNGNRSGWEAEKVDTFQIFGVNLERVMDMALGDRRDIAKEIRNPTLRSFFPAIITAIRQGKSELLKVENIHESLGPVYKDNWRYWIHIYPLIKLPLWLAGVWYSITMFANRLRPTHLRHVFSMTFTYICPQTSARLRSSTKQIASLQDSRHF